MIEPRDLTVVIPAYNVRDYIRPCLRSIIREGGAECPVIVIDDGSTDRTPEILESFAEQYPTITVMRVENGGQGRARNLGLDRCETAFVTFLDADDLFAKRGIQHLCEATDPDIDIVFSNRLRFWDQDGRKKRQIFFGDARRVPIGEMWKGGMLMAPHGKVFRRAFLAEHGLRFPEGMQWEDTVFAYQTSLHAERVSSTAAITYKWRRRTSDNPSTMQGLLKRHTLESRLRQIEMTLAIEASPEWQERIGPGYRPREFRARLMSHVDAMKRSRNEDAIRAAFELLRPFVLKHRAIIEADVPRSIRAPLIHIMRGNVDPFLKHLRQPAPAANDDTAPAAEATVPSIAAAPPLPAPWQSRSKAPRRRARRIVRGVTTAMGQLRWKLSAVAVAGVAVVMEATEILQVSELVEMAVG